MYCDGSMKESDRDIYSYLDTQLCQSQRHSESILYLPYLLGERSPIWNSNARGTFIGLSASHKKVDIVRAVIEGVSMNLKWILESLEESLPIGKIRVIGGVIKSRIWKRIISNILGKTITIPENVDEATSIGAAMIAGVGAGLFNFSAVRNFVVDVEEIEPIGEQQEDYLKLYGLFKESYHALEKTFEELNGVRRG
jgi:xylulokinase